MADLGLRQPSTREEEPVLEQRMIEAVNSLTERQKDCLRYVSRDRSSKEIARELNISDETVKAHLKAVSRKLGVSSRFEAARLLLEVENPTSQGVTPTRGMPKTPDFSDERPSPECGGAGLDELVQEEHTPFLFSPGTAFPLAGPRIEESNQNDLSPVQKIAIMAIITAAMAILIIAALPMADAFQRLAGIIDPHTPR